jgi:hypothetical protein
MKSIIEMAYKIVKGYMVKKINDTENKEFIDKFNTAFNTIEEIWQEINKK